MQRNGNQGPPSNTSAGVAHLHALVAAARGGDAELAARDSDGEMVVLHDAAKAEDGAARRTVALQDMRESERERERERERAWQSDGDVGTRRKRTTLSLLVSHQDSWRSRSTGSSAARASRTQPACATA